MLKNLDPQAQVARTGLGAASSVDCRMEERMCLCVYDREGDSCVAVRSDSNP